MKSITLVLFLLLTTPRIFAGDEVNNGGGISESNFALAYTNLAKYIDFCSKVTRCNVSKSENIILDQIKESLLEEYNNKKQLQFLSETKNPGTFIINGELKVAKTGDDVGSPIMINTDLIYYTNAETKTKSALTIAQAVTILIHEMGHHHGVSDHTKLDLLGAKVSIALQENIANVNILPNYEGVKSIIINGKKKNDFPQIIFYIFGKTVDATEQFKKALSCSKLRIPLPIDLPSDIALSFKKPKGATYHNTHWYKLKFRKKTGTFGLKGNLTKYCKKKANIFYSSQKYKGLITFKVEKFKNKEGKDSWRYEEGSLKVKEDLDAWWQIIKLPGLGDL